MASEYSADLIQNYCIIYHWSIALFGERYEDFNSLGIEFPTRNGEVPGRPCVAIGFAGGTRLKTPAAVVHHVGFHVITARIAIDRTNCLNYTSNI